jgi:20S proteasome subunit beta 3
VLTRLSKSFMEYNGGSVVAMIGKDCVAIASDLRLGQRSLGISSNFERVRNKLIVHV